MNKRRKLSAKAVIRLLNLQSNDVEGGYFSGVYPPEGTKNAPSSAIYYFLDRSSCSIMHMVTTDMLYHFYDGNPIEMLLLYPKGHVPSSEVCLFGNNLIAGERPVKVIPGGTYIGSKISGKGSWALMGVSMAPAFNPKDYFIGERQSLIEMYPDRKQLIIELTKDPAG